MIAPSERALCTRVVSQVFEHLEAKDSDALQADLRELSDTYVYSDYPFYRQWDNTKPHIVRLLFSSLTFDEFLAFPAGRNFHGFETIRALDELADEIPLSHLPALCERFGFPGAYKEQRLFRKLCDAPDEAITNWLEGWIENCLFQQDQELVARDVWTASHQLAAAVKILSHRRDEKSLALCARYARELPWGTLAYHSVTYALLNGLKTQDSEQSRAILRDFVHQHDQPDAMRRQALSQLVETAPQEVLQWTLADLRRASDAETREEFLLWMRTSAKFLTPVHGLLEPQIETAHWSSLSRALLNQVWRQHFPLWPTESDDSLLSFVIAVFERLRWNSSGCGFSLLALLAGSQCYLWILSQIVGEPPASRRWIDHFIT